MDWLTEWATQAWADVQASVTNPDTWWQAGIIALAVAVGLGVALFLRRGAKVAQSKIVPDTLKEFNAFLTGFRKLLIPLVIFVALSVARNISEDALGVVWLVRIAQGLSLIWLIYSFVGLFTVRSAFVIIMKWVGVIIALLHVFGWLDEITNSLKSVSLDAGSFELNLYAITRAILFGIVLFWLGRVSNDTGQRVIRERTAMEPGAREVIAKIFQIALYAVIVILLLSVMGIPLTAFAVFGGAVGIGLGVGLQAIASNFISGLIILLDRSITIGDFIELDDGRSGTLTDLNIRSATLQTFDGKDIMVPNETFITSTFVNWTHRDIKQRYDLRFQVAYATDLDALFEIVREVVAAHPKVLSGEDVPIEERPDAEIEAFADSGIDILVEFWMEGIDDGENRVGADLLLMIWTALKANGIEIPFPQREIKVLGDVRTAKT